MGYSEAMRWVIKFLSVASLLASLNQSHGEPGALDLLFDPGTAAGTNCCSIRGVHSVALQTDGKIVAAGGFTTNNATAGGGIVRLNPDGSVDEGFRIGSGANRDVYSLAIDKEGRIILAGGFQSINGVPRSYIARLNSDGTVDSSFDPGTGPDSWVNWVLLQPDGKLIIEGNFTSINGVPCSRLARLNADGSLDRDFAPPPNLPPLIDAGVLQPDGKLLIVGLFYTVGGRPAGSIARLTSTGTVDTTFSSNPGANSRVSNIALQSDGRIIINGLFYTYNGVSRHVIARLNPDGSLDPSFMAQVDSVTPIAPQPDGKLLLGSFGSFVRLNADGSMDTNFNVGSVSPAPVYAIAIQPDGKIVLGGEFTAINGFTRYHVARIDGYPQLIAIPHGPNIVVSWPASYTNFTLEAATSLSLPNEWQAATNVPVIVDGRSTITNSIDKGTRFYRLRR
jgi:uncharacterized delta-60 repeat protein